MKKVMMITCACLWLGCGTINKDKLFSKNITSESLAMESTQALELQQTINIRDSTSNMMELTIWPKGPFTFSPATGFAGEAFKMEWKGKQSSLVEFNKVTSTSKQATIRLKQKKKSVAKLKQKKVEWEGIRYGVGIWMAVVLAIGIWLVRKRWKLFRV
ncbi:MAG: hypothetical protein EOO91_15850 [Pedobacter sp.]|nr:MAG: hypothetical protein EOO91_15850 [Pedobacter sp.]